MKGWSSLFCWIMDTYDDYLNTFHRVLPRAPADGPRFQLLQALVQESQFGRVLSRTPSGYIPR